MIAKLAVFYLITLVIVAALAPMPKAPQPQPKPQSIIVPLDVGLTLAATGDYWIKRYV